jgi:hypothetical protein
MRDCIRTRTRTRQRCVFVLVASYVAYHHHHHHVAQSEARAGVGSASSGNMLTRCSFAQPYGMSVSLWDTEPDAGALLQNTT